MNIRLALFLLLFTTIAPVSAWSRSRPNPDQHSDVSDPAYVAALATANHFLHAWQTADVEAGMVLLSDHIRHSQNADEVEAFFSGARSGTHFNDRAFEITRGHGHGGRYNFPVVLVTTQGSHLRRKFSEVTVLNNGMNDWVVEKLP